MDELEKQIGQNIKKYRQIVGYTQEKLAELLDISHQAVSKWKSCNTYHDINMLPKLDYIFNVTINDIFGYNNYNIENEIREILINIEKQGELKNLVSAEEICRQGLCKYPLSYALSVKLAIILKTRYFYERDKDENLLYKAIGLCEKNLTNCSEESTCILARRTLAISYGYLGNEAKALEIANCININYDNIKIYILNGQEKVNECMFDINNYFIEIEKRFKIISKVYNNNQNIIKMEQCNELRREIERLHSKIDMF